MKSGPLILKTALRERHIDTNATSTVIKMKLYNLDTYIAPNGNDFTKFNVHVKTLIQSQLARRKMSTDLMAKLFKGYKMILKQ